MAQESSQSSFERPTEWLKGSVLGSGSHGTVHLAIDSSTGALFVSKSAKSESGVSSLKNEAEILENLSSPHVVRYFGKDATPSRNGEPKFSLFFEYMAGGSLSDLAKKFGGSLDEKVIRLYTREILHGLKYLHEKGIVHSDVKCKNVLLGSTGNVKLADFGCAKRIKSNTAAMKCDSIGGTPLWMSPEALRQEQIGFAADIWSLGCTVIEMATGRPPWDCCEAMIFLKIAKGTDLPKFPGNFSAEGSDFLAKCLVRDPRKRWTSEELLRHPFVMGSVCKENGGSKLGMFSPTSILNLAVYDSDDEEGVGGGGDDGCVDRSECKCDLESSDSWITVRR